MTEHEVVTPEEWNRVRDDLLKDEKELTRRNDELTRRRRELPWVPVEKEYSFETDDGTKTLAELFDGRSQLLIYHFMFGPVYEAGCTVLLDRGQPRSKRGSLEGQGRDPDAHPRAPLDKLRAYKERMGWNIDWASTAGSDFNRDLGFTHTEEEDRSWRARSLQW